MQTPPYKPLRFTDLADTELGIALWAFLNERDNILRMETASDLRRPAVEGIVRGLLNTFDRSQITDRVKRMIGHMTRQIMVDRGFGVDVQNVRVRTGDLFSRGTRYQRIQTQTEPK